MQQWDSLFIEDDKIKSKKRGASFTSTFAMLKVTFQAKEIGKIRPVAKFLYRAIREFPHPVKICWAAVARELESYSPSNFVEKINIDERAA